METYYIIYTFEVQYGDLRYKVYIPEIIKVPLNYSSKLIFSTKGEQLASELFGTSIKEDEWYNFNDNEYGVKYYAYTLVPDQKTYELLNNIL